MFILFEPIIPFLEIYPKQIIWNVEKLYVQRYLLELLTIAKKEKKKKNYEYSTQLWNTS